MNKNNGLFIGNSEYVLTGHPDKLCDGIAETIAMSIFNLDGLNGRSACELLFSGVNLVIGGEFVSSLQKDDFQALINWIARKIISKQTDHEIRITHFWQKQSEEIFQASLTGLGDNTIAYGYFNNETKSNVTPKHHYLKNLASNIIHNHPKEAPDGKLILINNYLTISLEAGISEEELKKIDSKINNPKLFKKSGALADAGVVGRKLIAERHGNGLPHGGGAFSGKDFTKGDKSLKLIGDALAAKRGKASDQDVLLQLSCEYGGDTIWVYDYTTDEREEISFVKIIKENKLEDLYQKYAPVKPSHYLNKQDLKDLETLLLKLSNKDKLEYNIW